MQGLYNIQIVTFVTYGIGSSVDKSKRSSAENLFLAYIYLDVFNVDYMDTTAKLLRQVC